MRCSSPHRLSSQCLPACKAERSKGRVSEHTSTHTTSPGQQDNEINHIWASYGSEDSHGLDAGTRACCTPHCHIAMLPLNSLPLAEVPQSLSHVFSQSSRLAHPTTEAPLSCFLTSEHLLCILSHLSSLPAGPLCGGRGQVHPPLVWEYLSSYLPVGHTFAASWLAVKL